ncbi:MAG: S41 family peptidase [Planctomycetes bacterium]|nr:S41 family peptidase [Planctomycetota bacterium]
MQTKNNHSTVRIVLLILGLSVASVFIWITRSDDRLLPSINKPTVQPAHQLRNVEPDAVKTAALFIAHGHFDGARTSLATLDDKSAELPPAQLLQSMLGKYDGITEDLKNAYHGAYQEYLDKVEEQFKYARWRQQMLNASQNVDLETEEKTTEEEKLSEQARDHWLRALAFLSSSHLLADRTGLTETIDPDIRREIVEQSLKADKYYQSKNLWNEAFARVYYYLLSLEQENDEFRTQADRIMRQAILENLYTPDPNSDTLPWQEKRRDINTDIVSHALKLIDDQHVELPDYREMSQNALRNGLYLAQTPKLIQAFPQLANEEALLEYQTQFNELLDQTKTKPDDYFNYSQLLDLLENVRNITQRTLKFPDEVIIAEFTEGAFFALDGYSYPVWPADVANFRKDITNEFSGIGVLINKSTGRLRVESLLDDSPAAHAGLDAGDIIVAIDGRKTANMDIDRAVRYITGPKGTDVTLTIERMDFDEDREFTLTRDQIIVQTIKGLYRDEKSQWHYFLDPDDGIAYVHLTSFAEESTERLRHTLEQLREQNLRGLVLDLRDNSGGYLSTAIEISDIFISSGIIVSTKTRGGEYALYDRAKPETTFDDKLPMVCLVNEQAASASEILSGALKDHDRALIVGARTYGKGSVQTIQPLRPTEAELKNTIAYYYLPSGRRVHRDNKDTSNQDYGVEPDVNVELTGKLYRDVTLLRREAEVLRRTETQAEQDSVKTFTPEELLEGDPQLNVAYLCLKAKLIAESLPDYYNKKLVKKDTPNLEK